MSTYTVERLASRGTKYAFALLLQHIRDGDEPFVTYGSIARVLEKRLGIPRIFPTHIGSVAGTLMSEIETVDANAPPINALITRPNGIPGTGFADFYNRLWRPDGGRHWRTLSHGSKLTVVEEIRVAVRRYADWDAVYRRLYGANPPGALRRKKFTEKDGKPPETARRPGAGESAEHLRLKEWAATHPEELGLGGAMVGKAEWGLLSGDRIDVLFSDGESFVAIEVKSILSSEDDWRRGVYQCVKYRSVLQAQEHPVRASVRAVLLTELPLTTELQARARELGVTLKVHRLNPSR